MLDQVTPLIITHDEAPNIRRTLAKLAWAKRIVVIDSGSTDGTLDILSADPRITVLHRPFTDFAAQCNYGLTQVTSTWVLSLDADYELSDELIAEIRALTPPDVVTGYRARFVYRVHGRKLRGSLYPPRTILYRPDKAGYRQEGHGHKLVIDDAGVLPLAGAVYHDDRKPLARWLASQRRYAGEEADYLLAQQAPANWPDKLRLMAWPAPIAVFFYALLIRGGILDGWAGWYYALQRAVAEALLALEIIDRRLSTTQLARGDLAPGSR